MYKLSKLMFLYCETSLHAGAGTGVGRIDLPIQREGHTGFPKVESSSLKGAIREVFESKKNKDDQILQILFGGKNSENSGAIGFTDARLLLFPVRSLKGIFAWVTCPRVLLQFKKDLQLLKPSIEETFDIPELTDEEHSFIYNQGLSDKQKIMLEEYVFQSTLLVDQSLPEWLSNILFNKNEEEFKKLIKENLVILHDNVFSHFVKIFTEVVTRNKINNDTGVVETGALFNEEYLPPHSVLYNLILASPEFSIEPLYKKAKEIMEEFHENFPNNSYFQLGANTTLGKGIIKSKIYKKKDDNK